MLFLVLFWRLPEKSPAEKCGMKLRVLAPFAAFLLAACAGGGDNSPEAVCRRQAYDDPAVRATRLQMMQVPSANLGLQGQLQYQLRQATMRCLQDKGLAVPGGVEPVRPPSNGGSLF
jgi:hypothetical protein